MAAHLSMSLSTFFSEISHREFRTWVEHLKYEQDTPSRSDGYLMQIAAEVRRVLSKKPNSIKLEHFRLKFTSKKKQEPVPQRTREETAKLSKAGWFARLGKKRNV